MDEERRFSYGFCEDLKELMLECFKHETDNLTLEVTIDGILLDVDMTFRAHREED